MPLHNSFEFVAYSYSNEYQFHTIIFNMYHTDIGEILWKLIHRIWNYNFDDIYIYYSTKESIYQYLLPSSSLFSILDVIRQYHISIACNSYPFAYFHPMNTQFYTINFNKRRKWDISQKPIRSEFENMISMISIFSTKEFYHCRHRLYSRFHASHHVDGNTVEITVVQGLANRSKRSDGERIVQGTRSKANPIPTKRFEANRELKSRDFRTRLEFKRGIEGRAYLVLPPCLPDSREFHRVVSVWHYEGTFVFPFLASLGKSFSSRNKASKRAALRRPEFSSKIRESHLIVVRGISS